MTLSAEDARDMVYGDNENFSEVESKITGTSRWSTRKEGIFLHNLSGKHFSVSCSFCSTEMQDESPFEYEKEVTLTEVVQKEVAKLEWVAL
jgi:hypothetical protein